MLIPMKEFPYLLISKNAAESALSDDKVQSNISVINFLRSSGIHDDELHADAFASYCVDYFYTILHEDGFASFVWKSKWDLDLIEIIHAGILALNDPAYIDYFEKQMRRIKALSKVKLTKFLEQPFTHTSELAKLIDDDSFKVFETNLRETNAQWITAHPDLHIATLDEMQEIIQEFIAKE